MNITKREGTITVPKEDFTKRVRGAYADVTVALVRELLQNAIDNGGSRVDFWVGSRGLTIKDNGSGFEDAAEFERLYLTVGGTDKPGRSKTTGGFGRGKEVEAYPHWQENPSVPGWSCISNEFTVIGEGTHYTLVEGTRPMRGCTKHIRFGTPGLRLMKSLVVQAIERLVGRSNFSEARVYLNGRELPQGPSVRDAAYCVQDADNAGGDLYLFPGGEDAATRHVDVRSGGLCMFTAYRLLPPCQGWGVLELGPFEQAQAVLRDNRDGFAGSVSVNMQAELEPLLFGWGLPEEDEALGIEDGIVLAGDVLGPASAPQAANTEGPSASSAPTDETSEVILTGGQVAGGQVAGGQVAGGQVANAAEDFSGSDEAILPIGGEDADAEPASDDDEVVLPTGAVVGHERVGGKDRPVFQVGSIWDRPCVLVNPGQAPGRLYRGGRLLKKWGRLLDRWAACVNFIARHIPELGGVRLIPGLTFDPGERAVAIPYYEDRVLVVCFNPVNVDLLHDGAWGITDTIVHELTHWWEAHEWGSGFEPSRKHIILTLERATGGWQAIIGGVEARRHGRGI